MTFNLVSILYYALQGAETYDQYIQDAQQQGGDQPRPPAGGGCSKRSGMRKRLPG